MSSFWGLPTIVVGGSRVNLNRHLEIQFYKKLRANQLGSTSQGEEEGDEEGEVSDGEASVDGNHSSVSSSSAKSAISDTKHRPLVISQRPSVASKRPASFSLMKKEPAVKRERADSEEEEEGAISSDAETGDMEDEVNDAEIARRRQAEQEVRAEIMARGLSVNRAVDSLCQTTEEAAPYSKLNKQSKIDREDLSQFKEPKEPKKPVKPLKCFSEKDVDYRAMWIEQIDAFKAPANHPFFQISVRNVRTKPYCDLWESEEKKDYLYYKPGTWDHLKDIPRLTEENLSKLSIAEAKQFVTWLLAERKVANAELQSLRRRFWAETDRHRRFKAYISGEKALPESAAVNKISQKDSNNPTMITSDGLLVVTAKEQKRLLQGISKLWMTEETSNLLKQKQRVYAKMKKRGTEFFKKKFKDLDRLCRAEVKRAKQQWESYLMDCMRQNGIVVGSILEECVERVATGNVPPDPRVLAAQQRRFWQQQQRGGYRGGRGGPSWAQRGGGRPMRGKSRADDLQL